MTRDTVTDWCGKAHELARELDETRARLEAFKAQLAINCEAYAKLKDELEECVEDRDSPVPASWWCTRAERSVLEAMAAIPTSFLEGCLDNSLLDPAIEAELARRAAANHPDPLPETTP